MTVHLGSPQATCNSSTVQDYLDSSSFSSSSLDSDSGAAGKLLYLPVHTADIEAVALLDSGSSLNIMSQAMLETIQQAVTIDLQPSQFPRVTVANDQHVTILGTVDVNVGSKLGVNHVAVYVLRQASHPLILGTPFLAKRNVVMDLRKDSVQVSKSKTRARREVHVPPNSQSII